jgi:hypothetical protein
VGQVNLHTAEVDRAAVAGEGLRLALALGLGRVLDVQDPALDRDREVEISDVDAVDSDLVERRAAVGVELIE